MPIYLVSTCFNKISLQSGCHASSQSTNSPSFNSMKTITKLHEFGFKLFRHQLYSSVMPRHNFFLFPDLKRIFAIKNILILAKRLPQRLVTILEHKNNRPEDIVSKSWMFAVIIINLTPMNDCDIIHGISARYLNA